MHKLRFSKIQLSLYSIVLFGLAGAGFWFVTPVFSHQIDPVNSRSIDTTSTDIVFQTTITPTVTSEPLVTPTTTPTPTVTPKLTATSAASSESDDLVLVRTFEEVYLPEDTLIGPQASIVNYIRSPENWLIKKGSYLEFDISRFHNQLGIAEDSPLPTGELRFLINNELLLSFALGSASFEHKRIRVNIPPDLLNEDENKEHRIEVILDVETLRNVSGNKSRVVVHRTSVLRLTYEKMSLKLDFEKYPEPFFRRALEPDQVYFVLPQEPTATDIQAALSMAAELGSLTNNRLVISATTTTDVLQQTKSDDQTFDHLIVIGQPHNNSVIPLLAQITDLPVELRSREMALSIQGPETIRPDGVLTYNITVTNTENTTSRASIVNIFPAGTELIDCSPTCVEQPKGSVRWSLGSLSSSETAELTLVLGLNKNVVNTYVENKAILVGGANEPINVVTLRTEIGTSQTNGTKEVGEQTYGPYFFTQDDFVVPEEDGIIQQIVSPWDSGRAILLISGLSEEAVYKAGQAMSNDKRFPVLHGSTALVKSVTFSPPQAQTPSTDIAFSDLGYEDQVVAGPQTQKTDYRFFVPLDWYLTNDAYLNIHFSHSQSIDTDKSSLQVLLNNTPIADVGLNNENTVNGQLQVKLSDSQLERGAFNTISIQVSMLPPGGSEANDQTQSERMWLTIGQDSFLHLSKFDLDVPLSNLLNLKGFPFPYNQDPTLAELLFVLPDNPGPNELVTALRLAAFLGDATDGAEFRPNVAIGDAVDLEVLSKHHIIALGRPSTNSILQAVNAELPQPFVPGTDIVEQQVGEIVLRLPPGESFGYIQQIPSPWNEDLALLAVTGTTDEGVARASHLVTTRLRRELAGNLALTLDGETVDTFDTREQTLRIKATLIAAAQATPIVVTTTPTPKPTATPALAASLTKRDSITDIVAKLPTWVLGLVGATILVVAAMLVVAFRQAKKST